MQKPENTDNLINCRKNLKFWIKKNIMMMSLLFTNYVGEARDDHWSEPSNTVDCMKYYINWRNYNRESCLALQAPLNRNRSILVAPL